MGTDLIARGLIRKTLRSYIATPEDFGAVPDLDGDAGTDNTLAFRALAAHINESGGQVLIRGRYRITEGFPILKGTWEFTDDAVIRNTTQDFVQFWRNTCVFIGTYFGYGVLNNGINTEPGYRFEPVAAGSSSFTLATPADAANLDVGSRVYFTDANRYPATVHEFYRASHMSIVVSIAGAVVTIRDPFPLNIDALDGDANTKPMVRTDAGTVIQTHPGIPATEGSIKRARLAVGVRLVNAAFESANLSWSQVCHIACHDCDLDFRWVKGHACGGGNPVTDTKYNLRNAEYTAGLFELAYHHHRVTSEIIRGRRIPGVAANTVPPVSFTEYGTHVKIGLIDVSELLYPGDHLRGTVTIQTPFVEIDTMIVNNCQYCVMGVGYSGSRTKGGRIGHLIMNGQAGTGPALQFDCDEFSIGHIEADNMAAGVPCVQISAASGDNILIGGARLGSGPGGGSQYRILDLRPANKRKLIKNVSGHYTAHKHLVIGFTSYSSTSSGADRIVQTYTAAAGTYFPPSKFDVRALANVPATAAASARTMTLKLTIGTSVVTLGSVTFSSAQSGFIDIRGQIRIATTSQWDISFLTVNGATSAITPVMITGSNSVTTNPLVLELIVNTHTSDSVKLREFTVIPSDNETTLA